MLRPYIGVILVLGVSGLAEARPVDLDAPSGTLGSSDAMGFVEAWEEVQDVDFGGGLTLPLRFGFSSNPNRNSSIFGKGWVVPLLDSNATLIDETSMRVELLCGKVLYLHRKMEDPNNFKTLNGEWKGTLGADGDFSVFRDDGWLLRYHQGRLVELKTDTGRDLVWKYNGDQFVSIDEVGGTSPLMLKRDNLGQPVGFVANGKSYGFTMDKRPMVQDARGMRVIAQLDPTLASFTWPGGAQDTFKFSVTQAMDASLQMISSGGETNNYTWDPQGHILTDNDWKYAVGTPVRGSNLPPLSRTNAAGQREGVSIDTRTGTVVETDAQGVVTTTTLFRTPGVYFNKVREVTETTGKVTRVLERRSYDEAGRLIRSMDESGTITTYTYDATGKLANQATSVDPQVMAQLKQKEAEMLKAVAATTDIQQKNDLLQNLGFFYIFQMKDYQKALQLVSIIPGPLTGYNVRLNAIFYNDSLTKQQKIDELKKLLVIYPQCACGLNALIQNFQQSLALQ